MHMDQRHKLSLSMGGVTSVRLGLCLVWLLAGVRAQDKIRDEGEAQAWLTQLNSLMEEGYSRKINATWHFYTNITEYNQNVMTEEEVILARLEMEAYNNASKFDWQNMNNATLRRLFKIVTNVGTSVLPEEDIKRVDGLRAGMTGTYSQAAVCDDSKKCYPLEPDLTQRMAKTRDWDELLWMWQGWRDVTGKLMKDDYEQFVGVLNQAARLNGFRDNGHYWQNSYETEQFEALCEQLWTDVKPLYRQLHAYVRRRLMDVYATERDKFPKEGHIPAHILGNMWAQSWENIFDTAIPFKDRSAINVTNALHTQNYNASAIFHLSDDFFTSLGLEPMPEAFWRHSIILKPSDRDIVCHASAWDFYNRRDFRIKMCTEVNQVNLLTVHHEMGHIQYYLQYKDLPVWFRRGGNPGFHEALGDTIALSVTTPKHLQEIGLLDEAAADDETDLNFLMNQALDRVAFLPFGYLIDQWRWKVFSGEVSKDNYNTYWWQLRCKYQGVAPPVPRSEADFDPGAKYHISSNTPYIRYFISSILQFQFHKALCEAAGHQGPLHKCDIYRSKEAGRKLGDMLKMGQSRPWPEALEALTGQRNMDASALLEYFQPLMEWLQEQNEGHDLDWEETCPPGSLTGSAYAFQLSYFIKVSVIVLSLIKHFVI